ncbi:hypothetical protein [Thalassomonas actiniarum]|uniref:Uncharacterized protein n=1 Tax=Thalassomonas actiniarum TaxID=485447 RepID=A0AAF0C488_9GAMM|nr:hypothetical protein [Thalassomonas actiniarum]WDD99683.1 hypothetical protein SG35_003140 [Thalassomonas actiniarum]
MAKPNDMPEFHSVKAYLKESLTENIPALLIKQPATACTINANSNTPLTHKGGHYHV